MGPLMVMSGNDIESALFQRYESYVHGCNGFGNYLATLIGTDAHDS